jgi:hypothetical protein
MRNEIHFECCWRATRGGAVVLPDHRRFAAGLPRLTYSCPPCALYNSIRLWLNPQLFTSHARSSAPARHPPGFVEPCLPTLGHTVPTGPQWAYEIKHDGFRFICRREGERVRRTIYGSYAMTADQALAAAAPGDHSEEHGALDEALEFLRTELAEGRVEVTVIQAAAKKAGIAERTLKRARAKLKVIKQREGFGPGGKFFLAMPDTIEGQQNA